MAFLVLGILFLRRYQRDHISSGVTTQQNRDDPKILADLETKRRESDYWKYRESSPIELSTRQGPVELGG